jgi:RimJ/RimL family protein N-acetyltransferase
MNARVTIRRVEERDLPTLYEFQLDPEASRMAVFPPRDWAAFEPHWKRILSDPALVARAIVEDGTLVGSVSVWGPPGERLVGYWIGREHWGRGLATRGLALLLLELTERPLTAHVAKSNVGSIRVLEKCGFVRTGEERSAAPTGGESVDEWIMTLAEA